VARFIATVRGQAGPASRLGSERSGIEAHPRGWRVGVEVVGHVEDGRDVFYVYATGGSDAACSRKLIGTVTESDSGPSLRLSASAPVLRAA
jgi:hypothetical protein